MCGIFYLNNFLNHQKIITHFNRIKHRGPDHSGHLWKDNSFFGCHRLSIINPGPEGNQPLQLSNGDDNLILICNGQIYNYLELAAEYGIPKEKLRTDVDVILHLYKKGLSIDQLVSKLDGVYAFVLYDSAKNTTYVARDPLGVRPLFIATNKEGYLEQAASEVKALILENSNLKVISFPAGNIWTQKGKESWRIDPSSSGTTYLTLDHQKVITEQVGEAQKQIYHFLKKAVIKRIDSSDRPVAFLCSGGIDSSIILCIAYEYLKTKGRDLHAYSMQYTGTSYDAFYASLLVKELQNTAESSKAKSTESESTESKIYYHPISFDQEDLKKALKVIPQQIESYDPNTIRAAIPMYLLASKLKETEFKVFLSGEGADELFMGYNYFKYAPTSQDAWKESLRLLCNLHRFDILRADRTFNAHGLELRIPYLDRDLMKYVTGLAGSMRMYQSGIEKSLLRKSVQNHHPELTNSRILDRQKERFSDGCGFSYVPDLLNYVYLENTKSKFLDGLTLDDKEKVEKKHYLEIFDEEYPGLRDLIPERKLPEWCREIEKNKNKGLLEST